MEKVVFPKDTKVQKSILRDTGPEPALIKSCEEAREEYGYSANPYCQMCHGLGFLHPVSKDGMTDYGEVIPCPAPNCMKESFEKYQRGEKTLPLTGISEKVQTFENFKLAKGAREAYYAFKKLATGEADFMLLLVYGGVGNGKTHLCNALVRKLHSAGVTCQYYAARDMYSVLHKSIDDQTIESVVEKLKTIEALIIDEFEAESASAWECAKLEEIIDYRYRAIALTVLVSNQDLDRLPERVTSRFFEEGIGKVVLNSAPDYRRQR